MGIIRAILKKIVHLLGLGWMVFVFRRVKYALSELFGEGLFFVLRNVGLIKKCRRPLAEEVKKILVVRNDRIGDLVLSTPAIRAIKKSFPKAELDMLVNDYAKDIIINNKNIDRIITDEKLVYNGGYDLAVALHAGYQQNRILFRSKASWRVGFTGWGGGFYLCAKVKDLRRTIPQHEIDFSLSAAAKAGADIKDRSLEISVTEQGESFAEAFFRENALKDRVVVVHPGARQKHLRWDKNRFAMLCDRLIREKNVQIVITGTSTEKELMVELKKSMQEKATVCIDVRLTDLISVLKRAKMYIGNMTGPMHIACALNISVLAITGTVDSLDDIRYWGPFCDHNAVVNKKGVKNITVDDVYVKAVELLGQV